MLEWMADGNVKRCPCREQVLLSPRPEKQDWVVQSEQERALLSLVSLQLMLRAHGGETNLRREEVVLKMSLLVGYL